MKAYGLWRLMAMLNLDSVHRSWRSVVLAAALDPTQDSGKDVEEGVLFTLNPKKWVPLPLAEKEVLTETSCRLRFSLPSEDHRLGLPVGKVRVPACLPSPGLGWARLGSSDAPVLPFLSLGYEMR